MKRTMATISLAVIGLVLAIVYAVLTVPTVVAVVVGSIYALTVMVVRERFEDEAILQLLQEAEEEES